MKMSLRRSYVLAGIGCWAGLFQMAALAASLSVPGFTAYLDPNDDGARVSERRGVTRWTHPKTTVSWFGSFKKAGDLECSVRLQLPDGAASRLKLTVGETSREGTAKGSGSELVTVAFGTFPISKAGYQRFKLESLNDSGQLAGDIESLVLSGAPVEDSHFNLKPRRNAASVHLGYPVPQEKKVEAFYCEVTAVEEPVTTFYMACGWHRGYFGMQVNSETERRIIFSVWDSGNEGVDRARVADSNRVTLIAKGDGVYTGDFGNEGTGGHSHLKYLWKTGEKQRFFLTAKPDGSRTIFSGYYFHPDKKEWMLISSWNAPKEGGYLRGLHSFSENFWGDTGHLRRKALYGNQWIRTPEGEWLELTTARFTHDPTGRQDRLDRFMGVEKGQFFLSHGGFIDGFTAYGDTMTRPAANQKPDINLPEIPALKQAVK